MTETEFSAYISECNYIIYLLWAPAQRKRATMLYFANVFF